MTWKSRRRGFRGQTFKGCESDPENDGEPLQSPELGKGMEDLDCSLGGQLLQDELGSFVIVQVKDNKSLGVGTDMR